MKIRVECDNVLDFPCDVLVLKYAQQFHGADAAVAKTLSRTDYANIAPAPGDFSFVEPESQLAASHVLFIGTHKIYKFGYHEIRMFAQRSMEILQKTAPRITHVAMTIHGVGYGLDERETFLAQIGGLFDAFRDGLYPASLEQITFVEQNRKRAVRLRNILAANLPSEWLPDRTSSAIEVAPKAELAIPEVTAGIESHKKSHIFVAMPFNPEMEDVYIFGIQGPIHAAGYLCERVDMSLFTGDILTQIKSLIENADLVIADLSGANANVYLEVGYAWGKGIPTMLVAHCNTELKFDVKGQNCILYKSIADLANKLTINLEILKNKLQ